MARHIKVTLEHHLDRRYHTINCGPGRRPSSVTYGGFNLRYRDPQQGGKRVRVPLKTRDLGEAIAERSRKEDELNAAAAVERRPGRRPTLAKTRDKVHRPEEDAAPRRRHSARS